MPKQYNTEIISVGTELLLGHVANTDARDISEILSELGINVKYHTVVGDNPERLAECVRIAKGRADIIITTGGLGPTCDDLTKQVLAESFGLQLVRNDEEYDILHKRALEVKKDYTNNYMQAMLPEGSTVMHNNHGTAPGCIFQAQGCIVIMLPGPPSECSVMFRESALPFLKQLSEDTIVSHSYRVFGLGEFEIDSIFRDEMNAMTNPTLAPYAKECDCLLKVTAKASSAESAEEMIRPVAARIYEKIGEYIFGVDAENIEDAVLELLKEKHISVAAVEGCTGGDFSRRISEIDIECSAFKGSVIASEFGSYLEAYGIPSDLDPISAQAGIALAEYARTKLNADLGIGIVGLVGPNGDGVHPVGTVFVCLSNGTVEFSKKLELRQPGYDYRKHNIRKASSTAFDMIRRYLTGLPL